MNDQDTSKELKDAADELKRIAERMDPEEDEEELKIPPVLYEWTPPEDPIPGATIRNQCEIVIPPGGSTSTSKGEVRRLTKAVARTALILSEIIKGS